MRGRAGTQSRLREWRDRRQAATLPLAAVVVFILSASPVSAAPPAAGTGRCPDATRPCGIAAPKASERSRELLEQSAAGGGLHRRERAVTAEDFRPLTRKSPGADVRRTPAPSQSGHEQALDPPVLDERGFERLRQELQQRRPVHTPDWSSETRQDPGGAEADVIRFGDGLRGRRPAPAGQQLPEYRSGAGGQGNADSDDESDNADP